MSIAMHKAAATAFGIYLALSEEEREAFEQARISLAGAAGHAPRSRPTANKNLQLVFDGFGPASIGIAPLPAGSGQRPTRLPVPNYDATLFASSSYARLAAEGTNVHIYVASCLGTAQLYRGSATTIYKVGTTVGTVQSRVSGLNAVGYAGWRRSGEALIEDHGFRCWRPEPLPVTVPRPMGSPVAVIDDGLRIALPNGFTAEAFDIALTEALAPISIARLLTEARFRLALVAAGFDPARLERYSPRSDGSGHKRAAELVRLQPRRDADEIAALVEAIVANHVQRVDLAA